MKPIWFTVAVLATALAMALAAFPSLAEDAPLSQAGLVQYQEQLQKIIQDDYAKKVQEFANQYGGKPDPQKYQEYQQQLGAQYQQLYQQKVQEYQTLMQQQQAAAAPAPQQATPEVPPPPPPQTQRLLPEIIAAPQNSPPPPAPSGSTQKSGEAPRGLGLSLLAATPLGSSNQYDAPFKAFGALGLLSIPLGRWGASTWIQSEVGFGGVFTTLVPAIGKSFNHATFDFPIRFKLIFPLNEKGLVGELIAGGTLRFFQYNDNPHILNAGLLKDDTGMFHPEVALGISIPLSATLRGRIIAGLMYLSFGLELGLDCRP